MDYETDDPGIGRSSIRSVEMPKTGSVSCLSKQTILSILDCVLSCITLVALIYVGLLILIQISDKQTNPLFNTIGLISLAALLSIPLGSYGTKSGNYCALLCFFVSTSYLLYALIMYIWFNTRSGDLFPAPGGEANNNNNNNTASTKVAHGYDRLHQLTCCSYTGLVFAALLATTLRIISQVNQIEPARVIVVDNNPLD